MQGGPAPKCPGHAPTGSSSHLLSFPPACACSGLPSTLGSSFHCLWLPHTLGCSFSQLEVGQVRSISNNEVHGGLPRKTALLGMEAPPLSWQKQIFSWEKQQNDSEIHRC